jgi:4-amino-4-deoxy-L-arabinose transferase-like glycosyltransferase
MRRTLARIPRIAWACAAIATVNAVCWAAITPLFWAPDEVAHTGYVQHLAETGEIPKGATGTAILSSETSHEQTILYEAAPWGIAGRPTWLETRHESLEESLAAQPRRTAAGQALNVGNYPPLYYALEAIPYRVVYDASFTDRFYAMRVVSALLAGLTALFVVMFLRELLPRQPLAWAVGGLVLAFYPMLGFMGGSVNNDNLLYVAAAALFFAIARAFRRGLSPATGAGIGAALAVGLLAKPTMLGLVPGTAIALALLVWRAGAARRAALAGGAVAVAAVGVPYVAWLLAEQSIFDRTVSPTGGVASTTVHLAGASLAGQFSYAWQALLPRLPFMADRIPWYVPWEVYFKGFVGKFGWFEFGFPAAWYYVAAAIFAPIGALAARALLRARGAVRRRWPEIVVYLAMIVGVLAMVEIAAYRYTVDVGQWFEQARYLFPLLPLYGALVALAVIGAGRWGRQLGALLVVLAMGHSLCSMLLSIDRFYV